MPNPKTRYGFGGKTFKSRFSPPQKKPQKKMISKNCAIIQPKKTMQSYSYSYSHESPSLSTNCAITQPKKTIQSYSYSHESPSRKPSCSQKPGEGSPGYENISSVSCLLSPFSEKPLSPSDIDHYDVLGSPEPILSKSRAIDAIMRAVTRSPDKTCKRFSPKRSHFSVNQSSQSSRLMLPTQDKSAEFYIEPYIKKAKINEQGPSELLKKVKNCYSRGTNMTRSRVHQSMENNEQSERASALLAKVREFLKQPQNLPTQNISKNQISRRLGVLQSVSGNTNFVRKSNLNHKYLSRQLGKENRSVSNQQYVEYNSVDDSAEDTSYLSHISELQSPKLGKSISRIESPLISSPKGRSPITSPFFMLMPSP